MSRSSFADEARAALTAGLVCGALDIGAAVATNLQVPAIRVFQSVASGWLGPAAYQGGWASAWLGLISHFCLMLGIAGVCMMIVSLRLSLKRLWIPFGLVWGVVVWVVMTWIVVPLSPSPLPVPDLMGALKGLAVHIACVGLPMAFIASRMIEDDPPAPAEPALDA